ncbi:NAD(P)-dependent oxidoreductase [Cesiribacter sp. SM1]|uniref:NAD-dependent epimerase/dehydratase family protein n=1 Tax=Cesiribacter sp. SM1 TaxID=2861196 RepID=UPI001CD2423F|nr:NAD(P)-dependent oxidoreductase [Cesiribacter sp. SM1]
MSYPLINKSSLRILVTGGSGFIGTNLIEYLLDNGITFLNVDWNPPLNPKHSVFWKECDIMDIAALQEIFSAFQPTVVIHLAARTDTDIYELDGNLNEYIQNTEGTRNVLSCISNTAGVERAIFTSTMFVCKAGYLPKHDQDYMPFTLYGVSKMLSEQYIREANLSCTWTIIRPQTIWGPWSLRYRDVMFKVMQRGLYFHPSKQNVFRAYGYVKNVVWQIQQIMNAPQEKVHQQAFYVGDKEINLLDWVQLISQELTGKRARILPTAVVKGIALTGDLLKHINIPFPLSSTRFNSMTQDYTTPIDRTYEIFGVPPYTMQQGVKEIVDWYKMESKNIAHPKKKTIDIEIPEELHTR